MKYLYNEKGIALVTSLMFTVMSLVITMSLLYMISAGTRTSGAMKRYKTTTEAAYGGVDIILKDILNKSLSDGVNTALTDNVFKSNMLTYLTGLNTVSISDCLRSKLLNPNSKWSASCSNNVLDASKSFDVKFNLNSAAGTPFVVYSKIVDTSEYKIPFFNVTSGVGSIKYTSIAGNSDPSSLNLEGGAVIDTGGGGGGSDSNPHKPYRYRIEVQAERSQNPSEKSKLSVLYIY